MKKHLILLICLALSSQTIFAQFSGGNGTIGNPYQVSSASDLDNVRNYVDAGTYFIQTVDIDLSGYANWNPIPNANVDIAFEGNYNGNGHKISNLTQQPVYAGGLFGYIDQYGQIENIALENVLITTPNNYNTIYVGALVGYCFGGKIDYCYTSGILHFKGPMYGSTVGGFIGQLDNAGSITNSYSLCDITIDDGINTDYAYLGGFIGAGGTDAGIEIIQNCYSIGHITGVSQFQGGFMGDNSNLYPYVTNCFFDSQTSGQSIGYFALGKTTAQMQTQTTFTDAGWDFSSKWAISAGHYPYLQWQTKSITWNGSWIPKAPTFTDNVTLNANYNAAGFTCNNVIVNAGKQLTIASGVLSVNGNLSLLSNSSGTATLINNGSLSVSGTTTVNQYLTGSGGTVPNGRYWYISSPVTGATSTTFNAASTTILKRYDEPTHAWSAITDNTTVLPVGTGYFTRLGQNTTVSFTGSLNTGDITVTPSRSGTSDDKRGFNLVGNPYPSFLNWETAYTAGSNIESTMWYRTYNGTSMVFDTYNATSHLGTNNNLNGAVTRYIPPMQAFWVHIPTDGNIGSLVFNSTMQSHQSGNTLKDDNVNEVIRLKVGNGSNSDETILVFNTNAQNGFDEFDSKKMFANDDAIPELYTIAGNEKLVINGLESIATNPEIALGFKTTKAGNFTISANEIDGITGNIVLEDKLLKTTKDLTGLASYSFTSDNTDDSTRFVLHLKDDLATTAVSNVSAKNIKVYVQNKAIVVSSTESIGTVNVFDVLGRNVALQTNVGTKSIIEVPAGLYFVKTQNGKTEITKKIIVE
jgi:hypothetical protein